MKEKKKSSKPSSTMSTRERMMERKKKLSEKGNGGGIIFPKEGTVRVRVMSQGPDKEIGLEMIQFYHPKKGGVISPATFGELCPFMDKYQELKASKDEDDQKLAKELSPRRRYIIGVTCYQDEKGKEVDTDRVCKPMLIPSSVYQDIIDLYLDEDDWGDMTDPDDGYDIKITRSGKGKNDTTYSVTACPRGKSNLDSKYIKEMDLEEVIRSQVKSYEELEDLLDEFLNGTLDEEDEDDVEETPKKVKKDKKDKDKKKKKKAKDI